MKPENVIISFRVPQPFGELLQKYIAKSTYMNVSEVCRAALRDMISRDCPELYHQFFAEKEGRPSDEEEAQA